MAAVKVPVAQSVRLLFFSAPDDAGLHLVPHGTCLNPRATPPILVILHRVRRRRLRPCRGIIAGKLGAVARRTTSRLGRRWVAIEAPASAQADKDRHGRIPPLTGQLLGIVARVKDAERTAVPRSQAADERADLAGRDGMAVLGRRDTGHIQRRRPTVTGEAELGHPLVGPPRHNRLTRRVPRRMVIEAAGGAGLGIAARPHADIDRIDGALVRERVLRDQRPQGRHVEAALGQGRIEAAPAAPIRRRRAQMDRRGHGLHAEQGVDEIEEGGRSPREAGVERHPEGVQRGESIRHHGLVCQSSRALGYQLASALPAVVKRQGKSRRVEGCHVGKRNLHRSRFKAGYARHTIELAVERHDLGKIKALHQCSVVGVSKGDIEGDVVGEGIAKARLAGQHHAW